MSNPIKAIVLLIHTNRAEMAVTEAVNALRRDPDNPALHAVLAIALVEEGKHDVALKAAQKAVGLAPEMALTHEAMANVQIARNEMEAARAALREAIRIDPNHARPHVELAYTYFVQAKYEAALKHGMTAVRLDPMYGWAHELCAESLRMLDRVDEALEHALTALKIDPESAPAHAIHGAALLAAGRRHEALASMLNAKRIDPNSQPIHDGLIAALNEQTGWFRFLAARQLRALERDEISPIGRITPVIGGLAFLVGLAMHIMDEYKQLRGPFVMIGGVVAMLGGVGLLLLLQSAATLSLQFNERTRWMLRPSDRMSGNAGTAFVLLSVALIVAAFFVPGRVMVPGAVVVIALIGPACAAVSLREGEGRRRMRIATVIGAAVFTPIAFAVESFPLLIKAAVYVGMMIAGAMTPMFLPDDEWK